LFTGYRFLSMPWTTTITAGEYWLGYMTRLSHSNTTQSASFTWQHGMISQSLSNTWGILGAAPNNSNQFPIGLGLYTATTAALPNSIGFSQLSGGGSTNSSFMFRPPWMYFQSGTA